MQKSVPIQPKTSNNLPKFCRSAESAEVASGDDAGADEPGRTAGGRARGGARPRVVLAHLGTNEEDVYVSTSARLIDEGRPSTDGFRRVGGGDSRPGEDTLRQARRLRKIKVSYLAYRHWILWCTLHARCTLWALPLCSVRHRTGSQRRRWRACENLSVGRASLSRSDGAAEGERGRSLCVSTTRRSRRLVYGRRAATLGSRYFTSS